MDEPIPPDFGEHFLAWLRQRTEDAWARYETRDFAAAGVWGRDWKPGTHWLPGLPDAAIDAVERQWSVRFPPDYRLFLRHLHATDRPMAGARYVGGTRLVSTTWPSFYNWLADADALRDAFDQLLEGILFDVEHNGIWRPAWGVKPTSREARAAVVCEQIRAAPRLVPVFGHRYLLAEPCRAGNPILSIVQTDGIIYGADLRRYLLAELAGLLGIEYPHRCAVAGARIEEIPFWGDLFAVHTI
jgi:hypothetical protein